MKVEFVDERWRKKWDLLLVGSKGSFLQSFAWGEFKKALGKKVFRLVVLETTSKAESPFEGSTKVLALAQVIKEELPYLGSFLYIPHGPVFFSADKERVFEKIKEKVFALALKEKSFCVRFEPKESLDFACNLKHYRSSIQALYTLKVDLKPSLEEIMASFKQKTRYNVRLATRKGVRVRLGRDKDLKEFLRLLKITSKRDGFSIYTDEYYQRLYKVFKKEDMVELLVAEYQSEVLGVFFCVFFGKECTYLHGATSNKYRNLMAPYALMWEAIKRAKERGCQVLDLWGVAPENEINHPWYGFTRFKRGFVPRDPIVAYPGTYFLVANKLKFWFYLWQKIIRGRRI